MSTGSTLKGEAGFTQPHITSASEWARAVLLSHSSDGRIASKEIDMLPD